MNEALQNEIREFAAGRTYGLRVVVVPDSIEKEKEVIGSCAAMAIGALPVLFASGDYCKDRPFESIRVALHDGYYRATAQGSAIKSGLNRGVEAIAAVANDLGGNFTSLLVKLGIKKLTNNVVSPLSEGKVDGETLRQVLKKVCATNRVLLYVCRSDEDEPKSRLFMSQTCAKEIEYLLDSQRDKMMVLYTVRESVFEGDRGKELKEHVAAAANARILTLDEPKIDKPPKSIGDRLSRLKPAAYRTLMHAVAYCDSAGSQWFEADLITGAAKTDSSSIEQLQATDFISQMTGTDEGNVWSLALDRTELQDVIGSLQDTEFERLSDKEDSEAADDAGLWSDRCAHTLLDTLESSDSKLSQPLTMLSLCVKASQSWRTVDWFGRCCEIATSSASSGLTVESILRIHSSRYSDVDFQIDLDEENTDAQRKRFLAGVNAIAGTLKEMSIQPWSPSHGAVAQVLSKCVEVCQSNELVDETTLERWNELIVANAGFLSILSNSGSMKLIGLGNDILPVKERNKPGTSVIRDISKNGSVSEMGVARLGGSVWLLTNAWELLCFPVNGHSRIHLGEGDLEEDLEDMSIFFDRNAKWSDESTSVTACCSVPDDVEGVGVLMVSENGKASIVLAKKLPTAIGERCELDTELDEIVRWMVAFDRGHDVFVATTDNRVLRISGEELLAIGRPIDSLVSLGDNDKIAAVAAVDITLEIGNYVATVTTLGYGKLVATTDFQRSHIGARGTVAQKQGTRFGHLCTVEPANLSGHLVIASNFGYVARLRISDLPVRGREHAGLKLMELQDEDEVVAACSW